MGGVCNSMLDMLVREGDTAQEIQIKKLGFPVSLFLFFFAAIAVPFSLEISMYMSALGRGLCAVGPAVFLAGVMLNIRYNIGDVGKFVDAFLLINTLGLCVMDLGYAATSFPFRPWSYVVLALDAALVFDRQYIPLIVIPFTLVYIAAEAIESVHRYGLYDAGYWGTNAESSWCYCASPPCAVNVPDSGIAFISVCTVFLVDFYFTRGFAANMRLQIRRMEATIVVASEIAAALARYDIDVAETSITS
eukprot:Hpha_TRINITY_DN15136_c3_g1::TRINITY_DN15136_c3_g1_i1::g.129001::m.129001